MNFFVKSIGLLEKTYNRDKLQKFVGNIDEAEVKYKAIFDEISKKNNCYNSHFFVLVCK